MTHGILYTCTSMLVRHKKQVGRLHNKSLTNFYTEQSTTMFLPSLFKLKWWLCLFDGDMTCFYVKPVLMHLSWGLSYSILGNCYLTLISFPLRLFSYGYTNAHYCLISSFPLPFSFRACLVCRIGIEQNWDFY